MCFAEINGKWDSRLVPTNSVYEQPQDFPQSSANVPSVRILKDSKDPRSSSVEGQEEEEQVDGDEKFYDNDYELEEAEVETSKVSPASPSPQVDDHERRAKNDRSVETSKDQSLINQEDYYYNYDDYNENVTSGEQASGNNHLFLFAVSCLIFERSQRFVHSFSFSKSSSGVGISWMTKKILVGIFLQEALTQFLVHGFLIFVLLRVEFFYLFSFLLIYLSVLIFSFFIQKANNFFEIFMSRHPK